jgi:hypothetical protein
MSKKNAIIALVIAALSALTIVLAVLLFKTERRLQTAQSVIVEQNSKVEHYTNSLGLEVAKRVALELSIGEVQKYYEDYIADIRAQHRVKVSELEAAIRAATSTTIPGSTEVVIIAKDTCVAGQEIPSELSFLSTSEWMDISGIVFIKELRIDYEITVRDSVSFIMYKRRRGFLRTGKEELFIEGTSKNPFTTVSGLQGFKIAENRRRPFGIGISAGYGISGTGLSPYIGVGLNYSILRF